ncbi:MAG: hypothetical protein ACREOO_09115 [bacterium]
MKMSWQSRILAVGFLACLGCKSAHKSQPASVPEKQTERSLMKTENLQKVYLDEMPNVFTLATQQKTTLPVTGNLPSGAYKFDHTQIEVKGRVIEVTPWAQYDPNVMAIQMLIPFTDSVEVGPLPPGEYEIRFSARSGVQKARLEVK